MLRVSADRPSADGRGRVEAHHHHREGARAEFVSFPFVVPPEAAFQAADELGFYFQVEAGSWANHSTTLGDGKPVDAWVYDETERILKTYGNHPSFVLMAYGNEPRGRNQNKFLTEYVDAFQVARCAPAVDGRQRLAGTGGAMIFRCPPARASSWRRTHTRINEQPPATTTDYRDYIGRREMPVIGHEIGQWCAYPNFAEIKKYKGCLKARNFEIFPRLAGRARHGRRGGMVFVRVRKTAGAVLQGGD